MPALQFILTTAGKNAIVNANNTGTNPITIAKIGIGSASWTPTAAATALNTEIKKITAIGGGAVANNTIHVTANDSSTDAYTVREIGLFTADNILVAVYSQANAIITKGAATVALIATDLIITGVPAGSVTVGDTTFDYPQATETVKGVAEIATDAEVIAGTDIERIVTPAKLAARYVKKSGDTMTGALTLPSDPSTALQAAPKQYVDARVAKSGDTMTGFLTLSGDPTAALHAAPKQFVDKLFLGAVMGFTQTTAPTGWLKANGAAISRTTYSALFAAIGTTYGVGNGSTTFNLPDLRGEFIRGWDDSRGVDAGRTFGSQQDDQFESHTHEQATPSGSATGTKYALNISQRFNQYDYADEGGAIYVNNSGGIETRPRNVAILYCIKF